MHSLFTRNAPGALVCIEPADEETALATEQAALLEVVEDDCEIDGALDEFSVPDEYPGEDDDILEAGDEVFEHIGVELDGPAEQKPNAGAELAAPATAANSEWTAALAAAEDEEPPFDAPDISDDEPSLVQATAEPALELVQEAPPPYCGLAPRFDQRATPALGGEGEPAPPIRIHVIWQRPEAAQLISALASDRRLSQAIVTESKSGFESARHAVSAEDEPDLLIVDTALTARPMLAALRQTRAALKPSAKIIVLGAVNDVALLRELMRHGANHYLLNPVAPAQVVKLICEMYEGADMARVIAVVGARGGVGASTVAYNLAWCIGARRQAATTLVDLDFCFGAVAFDVDRAPGRATAASALTGEISDPSLDNAACPHPRLRVLPAPVSLTQETEIEPDNLQALIGQLRRSNSFVILDLPHAWSAGVRQALSLADEVVLVATPDLASMRNAKNLLEAIKKSRPAKREPSVVLSMVATPKRPEIAPKEFSDAIGAAPVCSLLFDAGVFGAAELKGLPLDEVAPNSRQAQMLDALAGELSGLKAKPVARKQIEKSQQSSLDLNLDMRVEPISEKSERTPPMERAVVNLPPAPLPRLPEAPRSGPPRRPKSLHRLGKASPRRGRPGMLRFAAAVVALGVAGGWCLGQSGLGPDDFRLYLDALTLEVAG